MEKLIARVLYIWTGIKRTRLNGCINPRYPILFLIDLFRNLTAIKRSQFLLRTNLQTGKIKAN